MNEEKKTHILILEDQKTDAELAIRELRRGGLDFEALRTETRDGFLRQLREFNPDVIIADYSLPQFNGIEALFEVGDGDSDVVNHERASWQRLHNSCAPTSAA